MAAVQDPGSVLPGYIGAVGRERRVMGDNICIIT